MSRKKTDPRELLVAAGPLLFGERWQTELAQAIKVTPRTVRRWVAGEEISPERWAGVAETIIGLMGERCGKFELIVGIIRRDQGRIANGWVDPGDRRLG
jgi:hypothetical protein